MARLSPVPASVSSQPRPPSGVEWPTWALLVGVYASWLGLVLAYKVLGPWLFVPLLAVVSAWYMSLQHELVHGHPTRSEPVNRWLGLLPLALWYPFDLYRQSHLAHHQEPVLTHPGIDPESNYVKAGHVNAPWRHGLLTSQRTVAGRLLIGPALCLIHLTQDLGATLASGSSAARWSWAQHIVLALCLLWLLSGIAGVPVGQYLIASYLGLGVALLRSLYEHRPADLPGHRIVINEAAWPWRLLYLNNNYHAVHHAEPGLPWYLIPARYHADRQGYLQRNGGFLILGYTGLFRRNLWRPVDSPIWPEPMEPPAASRPISRNHEGTP